MSTKNSETMITLEQTSESINPQKYNFTFTPLNQLYGKTTIFRIVIIFLLTIFTIGVPLIYLLDFFDIVQIFPHNTKKFYIWYLYIMTFNTFLIIAIGKYAISLGAYPLSAGCVRRTHFHGFNKQFAGEFKNTIQKMTLVIIDLESNHAD